jgi:hypothetical protein
MDINNPTLAEAIAYLRDGGHAYELARRRACRTGKRIVGGVVCGESEDLKCARQCGSTLEVRERRGENNG